MARGTHAPALLRATRLLTLRHYYSLLCPPPPPPRRLASARPASHAGQSHGRGRALLPAPRLKTSPRDSDAHATGSRPVPNLPGSPRISPDLPGSPQISPDLPGSPRISPDLPLAPLDVALRRLALRLERRHPCLRSVSEVSRECLGSVSALSDDTLSRIAAYRTTHSG